MVSGASGQRPECWWREGNGEHFVQKGVSGDVKNFIAIDEASVSARTRHVTTMKWSFANKCERDGLGRG